MATVAFSGSPIALNPRKHHPHPYSPFTYRATSGDSPPDTEETNAQPTSEPDDFDSRLSKIRIRYRGGLGKKAERRKARKAKMGEASDPGSGMYLPPVPLQDPASEGLKVEFGFTRYSERVNGRVAILGITALLLVELATGQSVIKYHTPAIVLFQAYFVAAAAAVYAKYEKEKGSVWPGSPPTKN
ncbi:unnamed protein product [Cuscuta epithymum]|uniref:Uncharacterized protein n=1 Tax=Cuscuta epithymum TaxID=186058 RepID=A0AAV0EBU4_9ASTE|nr:unnamed protein product [Cuscuta epithymum]